MWSRLQLKLRRLQQSCYSASKTSWVSTAALGLRSSGPAKLFTGKTRFEFHFSPRILLKSRVFTPNLNSFFNPTSQNIWQWFDMRMDPRSSHLVSVEAFTNGPGTLFTGNPAAVVLLPPPILRCSDDTAARSAVSDEWKQLVAREMQLSETAFVEPVFSGSGDCSVEPHPGPFKLQWFTPTTEVDLCGHATCAAAHALWAHGGLEADTVTFLSKSGELRATRKRVDGIDAHTTFVELDFPVEAPTEVSDAESESLSIVLKRGLGVEQLCVFFLFSNRMCVRRRRRFSASTFFRFREDGERV